MALLGHHTRQFNWMLIMIRSIGCCTTLLLTLLCGNTCGLATPPPAVPWSVPRQFRILTTVAPYPLQGRDRDELPAELEIDFQAQLKKLGESRRPDLGTVQVVAIDQQSGLPVDYRRYAYGQSPADRPYRWYDAAIPYDFPEFADAVSRSNGEIQRRPRVRGGYFFNALGDWQRGRLGWIHTQNSDQASLYGIYFDVLEEGKLPQQLPPRGWLGDGLPRCDLTAPTTMGADHCRVDLDDWNGDGRVDLIVGESYGHVLWWPNLGTAQQPRFRYAKFVLSDGQPLDAGLSAAPKSVDWDGDGQRDLLVGTHWNRLLFYRNMGTNAKRRLQYAGVVKIDGDPLEVPLRPLRKGSSKVFRRDYYPIPEAVDWDGDGDLDLLLGGYITGSVFLYRNQGQQPDGTPRLEFAGPLQADNAILNVGHCCASPCVADFNADGVLDLMSGNMPMHVQSDEVLNPDQQFLQLYVGSSGRKQTELRLAKFPGSGQFPRERLATPRVWDWDHDGDLDLIVSARQNVYMFENQGTPAAPKFALHSTPIQVPWGLAPIAADQFRDFDGDRQPDLVRGYTVKLNSGVGNPFRWEKTQNILPPGRFIAHPSGIGDDWFWPYVDDFDADGKIDVLFGDWHGHIWFHRNQSTADQQQFDLTGFRLALESGSLLQVGPLNKDPDQDFDALQGARTVLTAADFNRDGLRDLVVGDTYGRIRYFQNRKWVANQPRFSAAVEIGDLGIRCLVDRVDWNSDGWPDVIAGAANGRVRVYLNQGADAESRFAPGFDPQLPSIIQPRVLTVDLNGDGDEDLFLPSTQGACFVERSFLKHGYARAKLVSFERRQKSSNRSP